MPELLSPAGNFEKLKAALLTDALLSKPYTYPTALPLWRIFIRRREANHVFCI